MGASFRWRPQPSGSNLAKATGGALVPVLSSAPSSLFQRLDPTQTREGGSSAEGPGAGGSGELTLAWGALGQGGAFGRSRQGLVAVISCSGGHSPRWNPPVPRCTAPMSQWVASTSVVGVRLPLPRSS